MSVPVVNAASPEALVAPAPSGEQSIAAYDSLAGEYDGLAHRTTRGLERLSNQALRASSFAASLPGDMPTVLEVGCGTGTMTEEALRILPGGCLILSDPAPRMLRRGTERLRGSDAAVRTVSLLASASEIARRIATPPDAILAGLADPYLSKEVLQALAQTGHRETLVFVTLPSRSWAVAEREGRLGIPLDRTRFRTEAGAELWARSLALDAPELAELFEESRLRLLGYGSLRADGWEDGPAPEVSWAMARPALAPCS